MVITAPKKLEIDDMDIEPENYDFDIDEEIPRHVFSPTTKSIGSRKPPQHGQMQKSLKKP